MTSSSGKPPWEQKNPNRKHTHLTPELKEEAKERAEETGRPYPNLVDNMWATREQKERQGEGKGDGEGGSRSEHRGRDGR